MPTLNVNGNPVTVGVPAATSILWTLGDQSNLTRAKFGRAVELCGTYTVYLDGVAIRSCIAPVSAAAGKAVAQAAAQDA